jgi:hypothetical protein
MNWGADDLGLFPVKSNTKSIGEREIANISELASGDIIRHKMGGDALVVTANYGKRAIAVRTYDVTNPSEWILISRGRR